MYARTQLLIVLQLGARLCASFNREGERTAMPAHDT
jgi:hypothetical protein